MCNESEIAGIPEILKLGTYGISFYSVGATLVEFCKDVKKGVHTDVILRNTLINISPLAISALGPVIVGSLNCMR